MNNIQLSIIIPVYNAERKLRECLDSVLKQDNKGYAYEVILVDDGSTDSSLSICKEYETQFDVVTVYSNINHGPSYARNFGMSKARGRYIGFVDADDSIHYDMYSRLLEKAIKNDAQIVVCNYYGCERGKTVLYSHFGGTNTIEGAEIREKVIKQFYGGHLIGLVQLWNKIYQRNFLIETGITLDETIYRGEDLWFNLKLYEVASKISFIEDAFYNYNIDTPNSIMKRLDSNYYGEWKQLKLYLNKCNEDYKFCFDKDKYYMEILFDIHALLLKLVLNNKSVDFILKDSFYNEIIVFDKYTSIWVRMCHVIHRRSIKLEKVFYRLLSLGRTIINND